MTELTHQRLLEVLRYNRKTGVFTWRISRSNIKQGDVAGTIKGGYCQISIDGKTYKAHRLAWFYVKGAFPQGALDHKDRCGTNNAFKNLRLATKSQNAANTDLRSTNSSGAKGVDLIEASGMWRARFSFNYKTYHVGCFATFEEAVSARHAAATATFKEFANEVAL
jgi:hypothetical protein